ncbi:DUF7576 family protein [Haloarchaeobius sp. TZWWS8]|uniref:DUF7576 family protein n=1 Tax=Haloarchaeobius sp. TZWWS8 TaxID=3446121 RepID=UPI003EB9EBDE
MVDPTSDVGEVDPDDAPSCDECGEPVTGEEHRVRTRVDDGVVEHHHFCDDSCLEDWES